jgi:hypothetical protein
MRGMILLANPFWQDRLHQKFSIFVNIGLRIREKNSMKTNPTPESRGVGAKAAGNCGLEILRSDRINDVFAHTRGQRSRAGNSTDNQSH